MSTVQLIEKKNVKGLTLKELHEFVVSLDEPAFRARQLFDWLYTKEASSFDEMTSLSKSFRAKLQEIADIESLKLIKAQQSRVDGTTKFLFELSDGKRIESVLIPADPADDDGRKRSKRLTLCVSTQVGCPLDCAFCATGTMGFLRNLSTGEILDQILQVRSVAQKRITNLVYMGMGEPLMNYENVMKSVEIITTSMGIAARRITISTAGWADAIKRMADEGRKVKLAVSLHTLDNRLRSQLMPINKKFNIEKLIDAVQYYYRKTKRRVTYEYILFDGLNDADQDVHRLIKLARLVPCKINIVPFHSIEFASSNGRNGGARPLTVTLEPTPPERAEKFIERLREAHITVMVRSSAGEDIDAACGQLAILTPAMSEVG